MLSAIKNSFQPLGINTKQYGDTRWWIGMLLVIVLAGVAIALSKLPIMQTAQFSSCLLYTSPSPRDGLLSRMPSSA